MGALECTEKGENEAAQGLARIGISQDPSIAFPGQRSCDAVRPIAKLLKEDCESIKNFEALLALGNLANVNETLQKIKKICEHALNLAHSMGIIKTYNQAVQEDEDDEALEPWRPHPTAPRT